MSEIIGFIAAAVVTKMFIPAGAKLLNSAVNGLSNNGSSRAQSVRLTAQVQPVHIQSVAKLRSAHKPISSVPERGDASQDAREVYITRLASRPFLSSGTKDLDQKLRAFRAAKGKDAVEAARRDLEQFVETDHQRLFTSGVEAACRRASERTGFAKIEALKGPIGSSVKRFAATDSIGRTIVTEIDVRKDGNVSVESEVLGVRDSSCTQILADLHEALEIEGLVISGPRRRPTAGICVSGAARAYTAQEIAKVTNPSQSKGETTRAKEKMKPKNRSVTRPAVAKVVRN